MPRVRRPLLALIALVLALALGYGIKAARSHSGSPQLSSTAARTSDTVPLSSLPGAAARTVRLIEAGGPFPYPASDGGVFGNHEQVLPIEPGGYYHEYTVPTPGAGGRGARRIVTGRDGEFYYSGDHYASFVRIDPAR